MNAIILAAGLGSRFKDITKNNHKALLPIGDVPNIERTIMYLNEAGISDINIVTGHMHQLFDYLKEKYNVKLLHNDKYNVYNNIYSFKLALGHLCDSFIIDADVVLFKNIFYKKVNQSFYYTIQREKSDLCEWCPTLENGKIVKMEITNDFLPSMLGISYWTNNDTKIIKEHFNEYDNTESLLNPKLYWDNIPINLFNKIDVTTVLLDANTADEMDTIDNYNTICDIFNSLNK